MAAIERYVLEDRAGNQTGDFDTVEEARQHSDGDQAVVALIFEYSDSELVWTPDGSNVWPSPPPSNDEDENGG